MSIDEATQIHEGVLGPMVTSAVGRGEGIWHFGWYIPFIPLVAIIGGLYISFLRSIPSKYARLFIVAGAVFVGGAVGVEMIQSYISFYRIDGGAMALSLLVEEMSEMLGIVIFVYALLSYISEHRITCRIGVHLSESVMKAAQNSETVLIQNDH